MFLNKKEIAGIVVAPIAAPLVFLLQGGFGTVDYNEVISIEFGVTVASFTAMASLIWVPFTIVIGLPVYLSLKNYGAANIFTLTLSPGIGCYLLASTIFDHTISSMFGICGIAVGMLFWLIARPSKLGTQTNT